MESVNGKVLNDRKNFIAIAILEKIYYNCISSMPLVEDLAFHQNTALPISHIFRGLVCEIVISYWLLEKDFDKRIAIVNNDFVKKNFKRVKQANNISDSQMQQLLFMYPSY